MKLRKTLAGILGAVVMLLGVGTFEHINRNTGVQAATETKSLKYKVTGQKTVSLTSEEKIDGVTATFSNTYKGSTGNEGQMTANNSTTFTLSGLSNLSGFTISDITLSMKSNSSKGAGSLSATIGGDSIASITASNFNTANWNGGWSTTYVDINLSLNKNYVIIGDESLTITISATVNSIYIQSYSFKFSKESSGPVGLDVPANLSIDKYTGLAKWDAITNASGYNCIIVGEETKTIFVTDTSYQLKDGESIQVCSVGNGTDYLDSEYTELKLYTKIDSNEKIKKLISSYYNDGIYTKKSEISLNDETFTDLSMIFHNDGKQPISKNRTTYYTPNSILMGNLDGTIGGDNGINSGYKDDNEKINHFIINGENQEVDWSINTNLKVNQYYVTLLKFIDSNYKFNSWSCDAENLYTYSTSDNNGILNNEDAFVKDFLAFAAPCLDPQLYENNMYKDYIQISKLSISLEKNNVYGEYLAFRIYVHQTNTGITGNSNGLLAESRVYSGERIIDESATRSIPEINCENGTVTYSPVKDYYRDDEKVTFVVTPDEGYIVKSATFSGRSIPERDENGFTFVGTISANNKLVVEFGLPQQSGEPTTYIFSNYAAGTQYAAGEQHKLDDNVTVETTQCHFTTELRIYASSDHNGYAIVKCVSPISEISIKANGNKGSATLQVFGSNDDGATWLEIGSVSLTSSSNSYTVNMSNASYKWIKFDTSGSTQIRISSMTLKY